jgi:hypothetical protein
MTATDRSVKIAGHTYTVGTWYKRNGVAARRFLVRYDETTKRVHYQTSDPKEDKTCTATAWVKWCSGA